MSPEVGQIWRWTNVYYPSKWLVEDINEWYVVLRNTQTGNLAGEGRYPLSNFASNNWTLAGGIIPCPECGERFEAEDDYLCESCS